MIIHGFRDTFAATAVLFAIVWLMAMLYLPKDERLMAKLQPVAVGD